MDVQARLLQQCIYYSAEHKIQPAVIKGATYDAQILKALELNQFEGLDSATVKQLKSDLKTLRRELFIYDQFSEGPAKRVLNVMIALRSNSETELTYEHNPSLGF